MRREIATGFFSVAVVSMVQKSPLSRPDGFKFFKLKIPRHFWTLDILLSTLDILLSTLDILPSTLDILPSTLDILPSTLHPRQKPTLHELAALSSEL